MPPHRAILRSVTLTTKQEYAQDLLVCYFCHVLLFVFYDFVPTLWAMTLFLEGHEAMTPFLEGQSR